MSNRALEKMKDVFLSIKLQAIIEQCPSDKKSAMLQFILNKSNSFSDLTNESPLYQALQKMDAEIKKTKIAKQAACKLGCFKCCYSMVLVTKEEAEAALDSSIDQGMKLDFGLVEVQKFFEQTSQDEMSYSKNLHANRRCIFLKDNNTCGVYKARPLACRSHFVGGSNEKCGLENGMQIADMLFDFGAELIISIWSSKKELKHLGTWISDIRKERIAKGTWHLK